MMRLTQEDIAFLRACGVKPPSPWELEHDDQREVEFPAAISGMLENDVLVEINP